MILVDDLVVLVILALHANVFEKLVLLLLLLQEGFVGTE